jgi:hypothetical protein
MRTKSDRPATCAAQSTTRVVRLRARRIASPMTTAGECGALLAAARRHSSPLRVRAPNAHRRVITAGGDETTIATRPAARSVVASHLGVRTTSRPLYAETPCAPGRRRLVDQDPQVDGRLQEVSPRTATAARRSADPRVAPYNHRSTRRSWSRWDPRRFERRWRKFIACRYRPEAHPLRFIRVSTVDRIGGQSNCPVADRIVEWPT